MENPMKIGPKTRWIGVVSNLAEDAQQKSTIATQAMTFGQTNGQARRNSGVVSTTT